MEIKTGQEMLEIEPPEVVYWFLIWKVQLANPFRQLLA
ncbi:hypothetical protein SSU98_0145 [Streptococcus suis 98HAH33]|nr:hypothetical protein SSU05_0143 [Streptococcus suis 05ZYH33]ABP91305.1 hypothetical protein SSU98_0145 [Streptococcus suis 98HAH33]